MNRRFDSVQMFFKLQDRYDRAFPWLVAFTVCFAAPIFATWIESR